MKYRLLTKRLVFSFFRANSVTIGTDHLALCDLIHKAFHGNALRDAVRYVEQLFSSFWQMIEIHANWRESVSTIRTRNRLNFIRNFPLRRPVLLLSFSLLFLNSFLVFLVLHPLVRVFALWIFQSLLSRVFPLVGF